MAALRKEITQIETKLDEISDKKTAEFDEFDAVSKYRKQFAEIMKAGYSPEKMYAELIHLRDNVKQQKAFAKNHCNDTEQVKELEDFNKNELHPELARLSSMLRDARSASKDDAFGEEFEQIMRSSDPLPEKRRRLIDLRNRVQKKIYQY